MGEVSCDILTGDNIYCLFIRYVDTTHQKITKFNSPSIENGTLRDNVMQVIFYGGILPKFPTELADFFPNLKFIDIHDCGLKEIHKDDLKEFKNLQKLKLESNKLKFLPANLFDYTPNITHLSFANNQIARIGSSLLDNGENLLEADFRGNKNVNFCYRKELDNLNQLKWIIESDCKIVKDLQMMAIEVLKNSVSLSNVEDIMFIADRLRVDELKAKCENLINKQKEDEENRRMSEVFTQMKWLRTGRFYRGSF